VEPVAGLPAVDSTEKVGKAANSRTTDRDGRPVAGIGFAEHALGDVHGGRYDERRLRDALSWQTEVAHKLLDRFV
jgi:hypothetical protein